MSWTAFLNDFDWDAIATAFTGVLAVGSASFFAHRQLKIKEQELRLFLLKDRLDLISQFRDLQNAWFGKASLNDEQVRDFSKLAHKVEIYFDEETTKRFHEIVDLTWEQYGADSSARIYREDEMVTEAREEVKKGSAIRRSLVKKMPEAVSALIAKTRIAGNL